MSERRLRDDIREAYQSKEPSRATLERLMAMESAVHRRRSSRTRPMHRAWLTAAAIVLCVASLWSVFSDRDTGGIARGIADEIAMNHTKRLDIEFETESYAELRRVMDRLDFSLVEPSRTDEGGLRLVGARYCSIRGQLAAQLRLETGGGKTLTLYQTALTDDLAGLEKSLLPTGGLTIDLWQEDGVFLGLARGP